MDFTDTQLEALAVAQSLFTSGKGFVPTVEAESECEELVEAGWLSAERKENGDVAYGWTQQAELALDLNSLTDVRDRLN